MKVFIYLAVIAAVAVAFPQKEGNAYTQEAIKQAQNTLLIPKDAQIQKVIKSTCAFFSFLTVYI